MCEQGDTAILDITFKVVRIQKPPCLFDKDLGFLSGTQMYAADMQ